MAKPFSLEDTYFKFPVRIYSEVDIKKVIQEEDRRELSGLDIIPTEAPFTIGFARIPYRLAKELYWIDAFTKTRTIKEVDDEGFDHTLLYTLDGDVFTCGWKRDKFEKNYFEYLEKTEAFLEEREKKSLENKVL